MGRLNAGLRTRQKKSFDSFMPEYFYHRDIVMCIFTVIKQAPTIVPEWDESGEKETGGGGGRIAGSMRVA